MSSVPVLGPVGPAQSEELMHFTARGGTPSVNVPEEISRLNARERLDAILTAGQLRGFRVFGTSLPCLCFSESPPDHLSHLIADRGFEPWGIAVTRDQMIKIGGGSVAYVPSPVYATFKKAGLEHWAVRTDSDSTWLHEREWRLPLQPPHDRAGLTSLAAILIGDLTWRPSLVGTGRWADRETGEQLLAPDGRAGCEEIKDFPELWRRTPIWVWSPEHRDVLKLPPGALGHPASASPWGGWATS